MLCPSVWKPLNFADFPLQKKEPPWVPLLLHHSQDSGGFYLLEWAQRKLKVFSDVAVGLSFLLPLNGFSVVWTNKKLGRRPNISTDFNRVWILLDEISCQAMVPTLKLLGPQGPKGQKPGMDQGTCNKNHKNLIWKLQTFKVFTASLIFHNILFLLWETSNVWSIKSKSSPLKSASTKLS